MPGRKDKRMYTVPQQRNTGDSSNGEHQWSAWETTIPATCTEDGEQTRSCEICKQKKHSQLNLLAIHRETGKQKLQQAVPKKEPGKEVYCMREVLERRAIEKIPHTEGEWKATKAATCTEAGEKALICSVCGKTIRTEEIAAIGHKWMKVL